MYLVRPTGGIADNGGSCVDQNKIIRSKANADQRIQHVMEHIYHSFHNIQAGAVVIPSEVQRWF